jgi:hypothetical protein
MSNTTTDLEVLRFEPERFTWGEYIAAHDIGPYQIVEYYPWAVRGCEVLSGLPNYDQRRYHGYILGKSTSHGWDTLDAALAGLIAYRQEGPNSQAGNYFIRMLRVIA